MEMTKLNPCRGSGPKVFQANRDVAN